MTALENLPPLREVVAQLKLHASQKLGQNFIFDLNLTRRIARAATPLDTCSVVEIGAGPGGLTRALIHEGAKHIVAIEIDARCITALEDIAAATQAKLTIIHNDIRKINLRDYIRPPFKIVANLPYNIATTLIIGWLDAESAPASPAWESLTLMVQKEVAARLCATPNTSAYGRLSVLTNWRAIPKILFDVAPEAFTPSPGVISTLVQITPRPHPLADASPALLQKITAAAFGQRRKMLRSALKSLCSDSEAWLVRANIDAHLRAESLTVEQFCALAQTYQP